MKKMQIKIAKINVGTTITNKGDNAKTRTSAADR